MAQTDGRPTVSGEIICRTVTETALPLVSFIIWLFGFPIASAMSWAMISCRATPNRVAGATGLSASLYRNLHIGG
jgi:hypothetical protein